MTSETLVFYRHQEDSDCSYLDDRQSNNIFLDPQQDLNHEDINRLHANGFRRSGRLLYRPDCQDCQQCQSSRVINDEFQPRKSQKKTLRRNKDIRLQWARAEFSDEHFALYSRYIDARHADGSMFPPTEQQYREFIIEGHNTHRFLEVRDQQDRLLGCCVVDFLHDGLSALYSYFEPVATRRSLGQFLILALISQSLKFKLTYTYLGYWIKDSDKMNYKTQYAPLEVFTDQEWKKILIER